MTDQLEVEVKYRVSSFEPIIAGVAALGGEFGPVVEQSDRYFAHPARDFAETDEALRVRRENGQARLTYKGPRIDRTTKTRLEREIPLGMEGDTADAFEEILVALDFHPLADVRKRRRSATVTWQATTAHITLDELDQLGHFVEVEMTSTPAELSTTRQRVLDLAAHLGLLETSKEVRSYLELLLGH